MKYRIEMRTLAESYLIIFIVAFILGYAISGIRLDIPTPAPRQLPEEAAATANIVAVRSDGIGAIGTVDVEITAGKGRVLINTNPFVEPDTQFSAETAVNVAAKLAGIGLQDRDVIFIFNVNGTLIGGPSAGAAMALAALAAFEGKAVRSDTSVTGTIESDGSIGPIGGLIEKAQAAGENGIVLFLVPKDQAAGSYYERQIKEEKRGNFVFRRVTYVPKAFELNNFTQEQYGMESREVATLSEAAGYMLE